MTISSTSHPVSLVEELLLLAIEDDGSIAHTAGTPGFGMGVVGACLVELNVMGRIDADLERITVLSKEPTGDAALDAVLAELAAGPELPVDAWVMRLFRMADELTRMKLGSLVARGILSQSESRFLWVLKERRYPIRDGREQKEAKLRILEVLMGDQIPTPHDTVLVALANSVRLLDGFLTGAEIHRLQGRIDEVGGLDLIVRGVETALREEQVMRARAMMFPVS